MAKSIAASSSNCHSAVPLFAFTGLNGVFLELKLTLSILSEALDKIKLLISEIVSLKTNSHSFMNLLCLAPHSVPRLLPLGICFFAAISNILKY